MFKYKANLPLPSSKLIRAILIKSSDYNYAKFGFIYSMNFQFSVSLVAIQFVNFLFLAKYLARITNYPISIALLTIIATGFCIWIMAKKKQEIISTKLALFILTAFYLSACLLLFQIPVTNLNLDRWSVISSFWDTCLQGKYPYLANSHMGNYPGPMPFYFLLFLPFHLLGEIGIASLLAIFSMFFVFKKILLENKNIQIVLVLVVSSAAIWYEIICRSTILTNSILVLFYFILSSRYIPNTTRKAFVLGIVGGFLLSTRNVFGLSFALLGFNFLFNKNVKLQNVIIWGTTVALSFGITFVPFLLFYWEDFIRMNPFIIQSTFLLPSYFVIIFGVTTLATGIFCSEFETTVFLNGVLLFGIASVYFIFHVAESGIEKAYIGSIIDITYFVFCLPFFFYTISLKKHIEA